MALLQSVLIRIGVVLLSDIKTRPKIILLNHVSFGNISSHHGAGCSLGWICLCFSVKLINRNAANCEWPVDAFHMTTERVLQGHGSHPSKFALSIGIAMLGLLQ